MGVNVLLWSTQAVTLDMTNVTVMGPKLFNHLEVVKTECAVFLKELASCLCKYPSKIESKTFYLLIVKYRS